MDSNPLERERGITILAKCTSFKHKPKTSGGAGGEEGEEIHYNIVDTPGHADFGSEVERVLNMVDGCMLVVDASEGPMPQTRYVLSKALARGLKPVVVLNKCDREGARLGQVENEIFDLFVALEASDEQLDFPIVYCSAREGWTSSSPEAASNPALREGMGHLLSVLADHLPSPRILGDETAPFKMLVSQMDSDIFIGKLLIGRIMSGKVKPGDPVVAMDRTGRQLETGKVTKLFGRRGSSNIPLDEGLAGDIVQLAGLQLPLPTSTVCAPAVTRPLYADPIDPPTISMAFGVNDSPLGGKEGSKLTSTMIADRLLKEAATNVALQILAGPNAGSASAAGAQSQAAQLAAASGSNDDLEIVVPPAMAGMSDAVEVRGRGELQLAVLIENMRREGFELSVSPPVVIFKRSPLSGETLEPYEHVVVDVDEPFSGMVIERMAQRKGNLKDFAPIGGKESGKVRLSFTAPSRGLIGFQSEVKTESRGTATIHRTFDSYGEYIKGLERKPRAVLVSAASGPVTAYSLDTLQQRGQLFVKPGDLAYGGMILGECSRDSLFDMEVNPTKAKKLTNVRAAGHDDAIRLSPPKTFSLEEAIVYVAPDELVEVTPSVIRLRKRLLDPIEREKLVRSYAKQMRKD